MVKRTVLVVLALAWLLGGCGGEPQQEATPSPTQPPTATPAPTDTPAPTAAAVAAWQEFTSEEGGFAVLMPSEPVEQTMAAPADDVAEQHVFMARYGEAVGFGVTYLDLPQDMSAVEPEALESILDQGRDGALASMGGVLVAEESISLEGFPGRQIEFELPEENFPGGGEGVLCVYLVGSRAYQVLALGSKGQLPAEEVDRFLASFRLLTPPAAQPAGPEVVLQAVFDAARSGEFASLAGLCDPLGENDGDTQMICDLAEDEAERESFVEHFQKGKISGPAAISADGTTAGVPFLFGPDGDQEETMVLILRDGRWYLLQF